jgi:hypothetical protein
MVGPGAVQEHKRRLEDELRVFVDHWSRDPSIKKIILFGSVARGMSIAAAISISSSSRRRMRNSCRVWNRFIVMPVSPWISWYIPRESSLP